MVLIVGCARSGTTLTAGIFAACGAKLGPVTAQNESRAVREGVMKPYLRRIGADPLCQWPLPEPGDLVGWPNLREQVQEALGPEVDCCKDPKICHAWPLWAQAFPEAKWVIVRRPKEHIVGSCMRTGFMHRFKTREEWGAWVDVHLRRFAEMRENLSNVHEVHPGLFLAGDDDEMRRAVEFAGFTWNNAAARKQVLPGKFRQ